MKPYRAIALAVALLLGSAAQADEEEEEEEESEWIEILVTGKGFSTFHAVPAYKLNKLATNDAARRYRLLQSAHYAAGARFTPEEGVPYYYYPRCHRVGARPAIIKYAVSRSDERLELKCPT